MRTPIALLALALAAAAQPPIPRYAVSRARTPVVVDGKLDDRAWQDAPAAAFVFPWEFQTGAKQATRAKLLWDDRYLYVGYDCDDADITAQHTERDQPTYEDDAVEIFINPKPAQTDVYFGLEMNARAVLYDYLCWNGKLFFKRFQMQGVKLATYLRGTLNARGDRDQGWSLEVAIPWENFEELAGRPVPGTVWTANLNRWDGVEPARRLSLWSDPLQPQPWPHVPARFGQLVFQP